MSINFKRDSSKKKNRIGKQWNLNESDRDSIHLLSCCRYFFLKPFSNSQFETTLFYRWILKKSLRVFPLFIHKFSINELLSYINSRVRKVLRSWKEPMKWKIHKWNIKIICFTHFSFSSFFFHTFLIPSHIIKWFFLLFAPSVPLCAWLCEQIICASKNRDGEKTT